MNDYIDFPKIEHKAYKSRLNQNKNIFTTRVSTEIHKYKVGKVYLSPFGKLKVVSLSHYKNIFEHPFFNELNENQIKIINKNIEESGFDLIELSLM